MLESKESDVKRGMSRAAKNRAKKKKPPVVDCDSSLTTSRRRQLTETQTASNGTDRTLHDNVASPQPTHKKSKRNNKMVVRETKQLMNEIGHSSDEEREDETIEMKKAAVDMKLPPGVAELPATCYRLRDIVALGIDETTVPASLFEQFQKFTSRERAYCVLQFLLQPASISVNQFYETYWEKKPLLVKAAEQQRDRLDGFLSLASIREILKGDKLYYGKDLNVTNFQKGPDGVQRRVTWDKLPKPDSDEEYVVASGSDVWKHWEKGCTVRLLCPHKHFAPIHALLSLLELEWGCMVGANAYLTPAKSSQGFAPHYDDIEAFCLQLEGRKRWKVYAPLSSGERLPRVSSADYTPADLQNSEPVMDIVLEPGDLIYMPRGWIHQACTLPPTTGSSIVDQQQHSLHLTVSAMQQWAWCDLMELLLPEALEAAVQSETSTSLREGLPLRFLDYMGAIHDNRDDRLPDSLKMKVAAASAEDDDGNNDDDDITVEQKEEQRRILEKQVLQDDFRTYAKKRIMRVAKEAMDLLDATCDQMSKRFLSDRLPPALTLVEMEGTSQVETKKVQILPSHLCRLARPGIARLTLENGHAVLYHCVDNSLMYRENPLSPMEFEMDDAPAIEQLLTTTEPHWIVVADLIHDSIEDKIGVAQALYDEGVLAIHRIVE